MDEGFLDWFVPIETHGSQLPHWQQGRTIQFVTFRLGDSLPQEKLKKWEHERETWLQLHPRPWSRDVEIDYYRRFPVRIERWLDQGMGSCLLRHQENRDLLVDVLMKFQGRRVEHHAWVIMPNHVHLLFTPMDELVELIKAWKGVSARRIGRGSIWQENYRDTLIRDEEHFGNVVRYIRKNPGWAGIPEENYALWLGERAVQVP